MLFLIIETTIPNLTNSGAIFKKKMNEMTRILEKNERKRKIGKEGRKRKSTEVAPVEKFSHLSLRLVARPVLIKKRGTIIDFRDARLMNGSVFILYERTV